MQEKWGDLDPEEVKAALDLKKQTDEKTLIKEGDIDKLIEKRMAPVLKKRDEAEAKIKGELDKAQELNRALLIDREAQQIGAEIGIAPSAYADFTRRTRDAFAVKDGKASRVDSDGEPVLNGSGAPQTIKDFGLELKESAGHLFTPSNGGGGRAGGQGGAKGAGGGEKSSRDKIRAGLEARQQAGG